MKMNIIYLTLCIISALNANVVKRDEESTATTNLYKHESYKKPQIVSERNKFYVWGSYHANAVKNFSFETPFIFDCYMEFLPIEFQEWSSDKTKWQTITGFIHHLNDEIVLKQKKKNVCRKIQRYMF